MWVISLPLHLMQFNYLYKRIQSAQLQPDKFKHTVLISKNKARYLPCWWNDWSRLWCYDVWMQHGKCHVMVCKFIHVPFHPRSPFSVIEQFNHSLVPFQQKGGWMIVMETEERGLEWRSLFLLSMRSINGINHKSTIKAKTLHVIG